MCETPLSPDKGQEQGEENAIIVYPIKPEEGSRWLYLLSGQDVGGTAMVRSGITRPGRQEPDPGAVLGHPYPLMHPSFCSSGW